MPYTPPGVQVTQIFASASAIVQASQLPAAVVGAAYQVVKKADAGAYDVGGSAYSYPSLASGATIQTAEVEVFVRQSDNTDLDVTSSATIDGTDVDLPANLEETIQGSSTTGAKDDKTFTDVNAEFVTNGVRAGDFVKISSVNYEVSDVVSETELTLLVTPVPDNPQTYTVVRTVTGRILITYVALRTDSAVVDQFLSFSSEDEIATTFGVDGLDDPRSILPFGLARAIRNAGSTVYGYCLDGVLAASTAHGKALDALAVKRVYNLAPLTYATSILSSYFTHANNRSLPTAKGWRRVYVSQAIAETEQIDSAADGATDGVDGADFSSAGSTFQADGVKAGDILTLSEQSAPNTFVIQSVDSETGLTLETAAGTGLADQDFSIDRPYTRTQMAETLRATAASTANQRVTRVVPDRWHVTVDGADTTTEGYFGAAACAGFAASQPIGKAHIHGTIAGFDKITHANDFFTEEQLNLIAEGGNQIHTQSTAASPIKIRDDLTTDMSAFNKQNVSMVISRDWLAYAMHDILAPQVGQYNITERFLGILRGSVQAVFNKALSLPDQAFLNLTLNKLEKNAAQAGNVDIEVAVEQGEPGKYINVDMVI